MPAENLPEWLATESAVTDLFAYFGFKVEHVNIAGRQIDLTAVRSDVFAIEPEKWAVEITTEYVDVNKGSKDFQKLLLAKQETGSRMMLVSTKGFAGPQRETLTKFGIVCRTYAELENHSSISDGTQLSSDKNVFALRTMTSGLILLCSLNQTCWFTPLRRM